MKKLIIILLLTSCGPAWKLRRAEKLIHEAESQGAKWKVDTVYQEKIIEGGKITLYVPVDRIVSKDTIIFQDRVKLTYRMVHDTVKIQAECLVDTVLVPVTVHKSIVAPPCPKDRFWKGVGWGAGGLLVLLIVYGVVRLIRP